MTANDIQQMAQELKQLLGMQSQPLGITFSQEAPQGVAPYTAPMPTATADGRTGRVAAGCVFWMKAQDGTFTTIAEDHANCNVGSLTHGFKTLEEAAGGGDVAALVQSGWVSPEMFPHIPVVKTRYQYITYGPLVDTPVVPDVIFLRINAKQAMMLSDAWPGLRFEGKPQCHIVPIAKELDEPAVSVGCMLSRVRTGMSNNEMTCAIPAGQLQRLLSQLRAAQAADNQVAAYASTDAARFRTPA